MLAHEKSMLWHNIWLKCIIIERKKRTCCYNKILLNLYLFQVTRWSYVLSCCQRYSTNIDSVITFYFNIKNIDSIANTASDAVCNRVVMLNELLQCRDG